MTTPQTILTSYPIGWAPPEMDGATWWGYRRLVAAIIVQAAKDALSSGTERAEAVGWLVENGFSTKPLPRRERLDRAVNAQGTNDCRAAGRGEGDKGNRRSPGIKEKLGG